MKKTIKFLFFIIFYLGFMIGIVNAQNFWVEFIDNTNDGVVTFYTTFNNTSTQTYYTGVAPYNNQTQYTQILTIQPLSSPFPSGPYSLPPGIYDIYITPDYKTFYWTSLGDGVGAVTSSGFSIDWSSGNSGIPVSQVVFTFNGDSFKIVPVPLPPALLLLGSGIVALSFVRKKKFTA